jgi:hypothetical protein
MEETGILALVLKKILHTYRLYSMKLNDKVTKCVIEKILILSLLKIEYESQSSNCYFLE